jgi:UDP-N-acetylmuramate dehydrogenase
MSTALLAEELRARFGVDRVISEAPLGPLTTFRVGGPADYLFEPRDSAELLAALEAARREGVPVTMLAGGSNVLVSDAGVRGLVIRPRRGSIREAGPGLVEADAAVTINGLVRWTVTRGLAGLESWAGTPGTVGGAIHGNAHFGGRLIGEHVVSARLVDRDGRIGVVPGGAMGFGYDRSRLQGSGEYLVSATFRVAPGESAELRRRARASLAFRKATQPLGAPSAGCVFQNPQPGRDQLPPDLPWSAGALIDRAGLKGRVVGGARVSPAHANFIVNDGSATAADIRQLIEICRMTVRETFGVQLRDEIVYLGNFELPGN